MLVSRRLRSLPSTPPTRAVAAHLLPPPPFPPWSYVVEDTGLFTTSLIRSSVRIVWEKFAHRSWLPLNAHTQRTRRISSQALEPLLTTHSEPMSAKCTDGSFRGRVISAADSVRERRIAMFWLKNQNTCQGPKTPLCSLPTTATTLQSHSINECT